MDFYSRVKIFVFSHFTVPINTYSIRVSSIHNNQEILGHPNANASNWPQNSRNSPSVLYLLTIVINVYRVQVNTYLSTRAKSCTFLHVPFEKWLHFVFLVCIHCSKLHFLGYLSQVDLYWVGGDIRIIWRSGKVIKVFFESPK